MLLGSHLLCIAIVASITVMEKSTKHRSTVMVQHITAHWNKLLPPFRS